MTSDQLTLDIVVRRSDALISTNLGDDVVMMDIEQGDYYGLEAVAARIWALTEQPVSVASLCERLIAEYEISPEQCREEVLAFVNELIGRRIVRVGS